MYWPVQGARISSGYKGGYRRTGGHDGVDFAAPAGSPIYAAVAGRVISTGWGGAYGNLTKILHDDGTVGYYAHQSSIAVKKGARVARGTFIGRVGSTGNSTGPHLHFSVYQNGKSTNPMGWLQGDGSYGKAVASKPKASAPQNENVNLPDIVQYRNPNDVLGQLEEQGRGVGAGKAAGGFATPALDDKVPEPEANQSSFSLRETLAGENAWRQQGMLAEEMPEPVMGPGVVSSGGGDFERLVSAIAGKESGGNYKARNKHSGALGKYQIMPNNIAAWSKAALGRSISPSQFLASPDLQDRIARHRLGMYFRKYGAAGAALAWYAGEKALGYSASARNRAQGQYPSMNDYVRDVLRRAGL